MIRARFEIGHHDVRPTNWPIKHPYWCSGYGEDFSIIVAYADDDDEIYSNWPEARELESVKVDAYVFTDRFPKPDWFTEPTK